MSNIKIFVSHRIDLDAELIDNPLYYPVRCGAVFDERENPLIPGDDTGDNISNMRMEFNELTVQYWAWKNVEADYYGLCHYRRYISFADEWFEYPPTRSVEGASEHCIHEPYINESAIKKFGLSYDNMRCEIKKYDIIISDPINTERDYGFSSNISMLETLSKAYKMEDYNVLIDIIREKYPEYYNDAIELMNGQTGWFYNCFIMKKAVFNEYCNWLFSILFELSARLDMTNYWAHLLRTPGHLSERLLSLYIYHLRKENNFKVCEKQLVFFEYPEKDKGLKPAFDKNNIPILFTSTDITYLQVAIRSLLSHIVINNNYDIIVFGSNISVKNKKDLDYMIKDFVNVSLRYYDPRRHICSYQQKLIESQGKNVRLDDYYRLCAPFVLQDYEKLIWLGWNVIIERDLADLYCEDLSGMTAAFVKSIWVSAFANSSRKVDRYEYLHSIINLNNIYDYVDIEVGVVDLARFREVYTFDQIMGFASSKKFRYGDTCIINVLLDGKIHFLDRRWNVMSDDKILEWAPADDYYEYMDSNEDPFILQYSGKRPWEDPTIKNASYYWKYARESPAYEVILNKLINNHGKKKSNIKQPINSRTSQILKKVFKKFFPYGSKPYVTFKTLYFKVRGWNYNAEQDLGKKA